MHYLDKGVIGAGRLRIHRERPLRGLQRLAGPGHSGRDVIPPPSGVFGCGASTMAIPGVYIWPLTICCAASPRASNNDANTLGIDNIMMKSLRRQYEVKEAEKSGAGHVLFACKKQARETST